ALRESEEKYRSLFENLNLGVLLVEPVLDVDDRIVDLRYLVANPAVEKHLGKAPDEMVGKLYSEVFTYPGRNPVFEVYEKVLSSGEPFKGEIFLPATGRYFDISVYRPAIGRLALLLSDVTNRRLAEEESERLLDTLHWSEDQFRALVQNLNSGVALIDETGQFSVVNPAFLQMFGLDKESGILNVNSQDWGRREVFGEDGKLLHVDDHPVRKASTTGKPVKNQLVAVRNPGAGDLTWMLISAEPLLKDDGGIYRVICTYHDVTERKRTEMVLRESEERERERAEELATLFDSVPTPVIIAHDPECTHITGNRAADVLFRLSRGGEISLTAPPERRPYHYKAVKDSRELGLDELPIRRAAKGEDVKDFEYTLVFDDGTIRELAAYGTPLRDRHGNIRGAVHTLVDVTERKRAEEALALAKQQAELYLDLMGHDINNIHQIAIGYLEMAKSTMPDGGQNEFVDKPLEVLQRSSLLIQNVRKLRKLQDGLIQLQDEDVCQTLVDVQREFGALPHKVITLNLNRCERCSVRANELLHDVFANLVSNAIKHTGEKANINIDFDIVGDEDGRYCRVYVEDDGPGIPDDFKGIIFNLGIKGTYKAKGMGLGLYLVKSLVDGFEGRVQVEDRVPGDHTKGARFVVLLPTVEKES
ncbi:MAG TPA: PAS domain-containing sensor histidine kinase, partial [Methanocella sp.]|nr:PAS domain-containing sensor histidine kinase [Methanocella sp.]